MTMRQSIFRKLINSAAALIALSNTGCSSAVMEWLGAFKALNPIGNSVVQIPAGSIDLKSRALVRNSTTSSIDVTCASGASAFIVSSSQPSHDDAGWQSCQSGVVTIAAPLASGTNEIKVWFKAANTVSSSPQTVTVEKAESHALNVPASDLGVNNYAALAPVELTSSLIAIADPMNDKVATNAGAVHLIKFDGTVVKSIYGERAGDFFGGRQYGNSNGILKLTGDRFAVVSPNYATQNGTALLAGLIVVYDSSGTELYRIVGDSAGDQLGSGSGWSFDGLVELSNGNLVVSSTLADVGGLTDAGVVKLVSGTTGALISQTAGDVANDRLGYCVSGAGIRQLATGVVLIASIYDSVESGPSSAGSVQFLNPTSGAIIASYSGDVNNDRLGFDSVDVLNNGWVSVRSRADTVAGMSGAGSIKLFNPTTGALIRSIDGNEVGASFGSDGLVQLANGNLVQYSGQGSLGQVNLVDGTTGTVLATITGSSFGDKLSSEGILTLANGNFVVLSGSDSATAFFGGTARLVNGTTGVAISSLSGDTGGGFQMWGLALANSNFIVNMKAHGISNQGRMSLVNGTTGVVIAHYLGATANDFLANIYESKALQNGNVVVGLSNYSSIAGGLSSSGLVLFINGVTGAIIQQWEGSTSNERFGSRITELTNGNFIVGSTSSPAGMLAAAGLALLIDGTTGNTIQTYAGAVAGDAIGLAFAMSGSRAALVSSVADSGGLVDTGLVQIIDGVTGAVLSTTSGVRANDRLGSSGATVLASGNLLVSSSSLSEGGVANTGGAMLFESATGARIWSAAGRNASDALGTTYSLLSNGDFLFRMQLGDSLGVTNSGAYVLVPMD